MQKPVKNIFCYDYLSFNMIMEDNGWFLKPGENTSAISICAPGEGECSKHWFKDDCHGEPESVFNIDFDDIVDPFWFENHKEKCYQDALLYYLDGKIKLSNAYFNYFRIGGKDKEYVDIIHALDYEEAFDLVYWIDKHIHEDDTIYVHCAAGASRSQGVVRYIVDTYKYDFDIKLNTYNPNNTYNPHVVRMLKTAYRNSNVYDCPCDDVTYFKTEPMKFTHDIKLNIL